MLEPLGDRTYVDAHLGDGIMRVRANPDFEASSGDTVYLQL